MEKEAGSEQESGDIATDTKAAETQEEGSSTSSDEAAQINEGETDTDTRSDAGGDAASENEVEEKAVLEEETVSESSASVNSVSEAAAEESVSENVIEAQEAAEAPAGWKVFQTEGGEPQWTQDGEDYTVAFSGYGSIIYDGTLNDYRMPSYNVAIKKADGATGDFDVVVEGGLQGFGTKVTVDPSLEGHVFVNELSIIEGTDGKFTLIGFEKDKSAVIDMKTCEYNVSETKYESDSIVYDGLDMYYDSYTNNKKLKVKYDDEIFEMYFYINNGYGFENLLTWSAFYDASNYDKLASAYINVVDKNRTMTVSGALTQSNSLDISKAAEKAKESKDDFFILLSSGQKLWLPIGQTGINPKELDNRNFNLVAGQQGGVYAYEAGGESSNAAKRVTSSYDLRYIFKGVFKDGSDNILGNPVYDSIYDNYLQYIPTVNNTSIGGYNFKTCYDPLGGGSVSLCAFTAGKTEHINSYTLKRDGNFVYYNLTRRGLGSDLIAMSDTVFCKATAPPDGVIGSVSSSGNAISAVYYSGDGYNKKLCLIAADEDTDPGSLKSINYSQWNSGEADSYYYGLKKLSLSKSVSSDGTLHAITDGDSYNIYGAFFNTSTNARISDISELITTKAGEDYDRRLPLIYSFWVGGIDYEDSMESNGFINDYTDRRYFNVEIYDSYDFNKVKVSGSFRIKAIKKSDPNSAAFLKSTSFNSPYGYEITGQYGDEGWTPGAYYAMVYFEPSDETNWLSTYAAYNYMNIYATEVDADIAYETENDNIVKISDTDYLAAKGAALSYEDIAITSKDKLRDGSKLISDVYDISSNSYKVRFYKGISGKSRQSLMRSGVPVMEETLMAGGELELSSLEEGDYEVVISCENDDFDALRLVNKKTSVSDDTYAIDDKFLYNDENGNDHWGLASKLTFSIRSLGEVTSSIADVDHYTPTLYYGMAQKLDDSNVNRFMRELITVRNKNTEVSGNLVEDVTKYASFSFATVSEGSYVKAGALNKSELTVGKTVYIKASYLGKATEPLAFTIAKQPVNIEGAQQTVIARYGTIVDDYTGDIMVHDVTTTGSVWPETYSPEKGGSVSLNEWHTGTSAKLDTSNVNVARSGKQTVGIKITLNDSKSPSYEVRSTGALYVVRSGGAISGEPEKVTLSDLQSYELEVKDAQDHKEIASLPDMSRKAESKVTGEITTDKKVTTWYMDVNDQGGSQIITNSGIVKSTSDNSGKWKHSFNIEKAIEYSPVYETSIYKFTFYASFEADEVSKGGYIAISPIPTVYYTGKAHVSNTDSSSKKSGDLSISVYEYKNDGTRELLTEGEDYKLGYKNNTKAALADAANAPYVTVTGKGAHKGLKLTQKFNILPMDLSANAITEVAVKSYYAYTSKGMVPKYTVKYNGKKLKAGDKKDYKAVLVDAATGAEVTASSYANSKEVKLFKLRIEGKNNYGGWVESSSFYGIPKGMKTLSYKLKSSKVKWEEGSHERVTKADYFGSTNETKIKNYNGTVSAELYLYTASGNYLKVDAVEDAGLNMFIGIRPASAEDAIKANIAPVTVYSKVNFNGLKFNKSLFKLNNYKFTYTGANANVELSERKDGGVRWKNTQVYFRDYSNSDGNVYAAGFDGVDSPEINDSSNSAAKSVNNSFPGTYKIDIVGHGCYSGTVTLTYKVDPLKAILSGPKKNVEVTVNGGKGVVYNAGGIAADTPIDIKYVGDKSLSLNGLTFNAKYLKSKVTGDEAGTVVISNVCDEKTGARIFKNKFKVNFKLLQCSLKEGIELWKNSGSANAVYGAIRPLAVDASVKAPRLRLEQYGAEGWCELDKYDFSVDTLASLLDKTKAVDIKVNAASASTARFKDSSVTVPVSSYGMNWKKGKLSIELEKKEYEYTGNPVSANVIVKNGGTTIDPSNYVVEYKDNVELSEGGKKASARVYFVRPSAAGEEFKYGGEKLLTFKITRKYD